MLLELIVLDRSFS